MRNPRRTAQTAAALMIGLALVSTIAVLGASLSTSAKNSVDSAVSADYIDRRGSGGFSKSVAPTVSRLPGVTTTTTIYQGQFEFKNSLSSSSRRPPANLDRTVTLHVTSGSGAPAMAAGRPAGRHQRPRRPTTSTSARWCRVKFAQTGAIDDDASAGSTSPNPLVGSFVVGDRFFLSHFDNPLPIGVLLSTAPGAPNLGPALEPRAHRRTPTSGTRPGPSSSSPSRTRSTSCSGWCTCCSRWPCSSR